MNKQTFILYSFAQKRYTKMKVFLAKVNIFLNFQNKTATECHKKTGFLHINAIKRKGGSPPLPLKHSPKAKQEPPCLS